MSGNESRCPAIRCRRCRAASRKVETAAAGHSRWNNGLNRVDEIAGIGAVSVRGVSRDVEANIAKASVVSLK